MSNLTGYTQVSAGDMFKTYASTVTPPYALGQRAMTGDGRTFVFAKAGAVALVAGTVCQGPAVLTNHVNLAPADTAIGATAVTVTPGATAAAANAYANGFLIASTGPGNGISYRIKSHLAVTASVAFVVNLWPEDAIQVALTNAASKMDLLACQYDGVLIAPATTLTATIVGVAVTVVDASGFGWLQTGGPASVLIAGTPALGARVCSPSAVAGAVLVDPADSAIGIVGKMMATGVDTKNKLVNLAIG
jgi:hypothetical protein